MGRRLGSTCPAKGRFGRDAPEGGLVMLTLSFVDHDPEPSLTLRGGDRRIQGLQYSTILAEDDCDHPSNQPRNVCAHIPNTYGRCRGFSSLRGSRLAPIARV